MKKTLIICGWFEQGGSYYEAVSGKKLDNFDNIIGFEAEKDFNIEKELSSLPESVRNKTELYNKAVWVNDDEIVFYDMGKESSSVLSNKLTGEQGLDPYKVEAIDFPKFLEKFDKENYELYIQMNIEGSEFEILDKMFESKTFEKVNILQLILDNHTNIKGKENYFKEKVSQNRTKLKKYFTESSRPLSGNPEDFLYTKM
tara:strand:- start:859 stop:1458 length:600 start_codon:yes stop_codon:yes gene_type:complete